GAPAATGGVLRRQGERRQRRASAVRRRAGAALPLPPRDRGAAGSAGERDRRLARPDGRLARRSLSSSGDGERRTRLASYGSRFAGSAPDGAFSAVSDLGRRSGRTGAECRLGAKRGASFARRRTIAL